MTWDMSVSTEIAVIFAGYAWHADDLQEAYNDRRARKLAQGVEYRADPLRRKLAVERTREWRKANPERSRELGRNANRKYRDRAKSDPVLRAKLTARARNTRHRLLERDPEMVREWWRTAQRKLRERKRAERGLPPTVPRRGRPRMADPLAAAHDELRRRLETRTVSP